MEYWYLVFGLVLAVVLVSGCAEPGPQTPSCEIYCTSLTPDIDCVGEWNASGSYPDCSCEWECSREECIGDGEAIPLAADPPKCCDGLELIPPSEANVVGISGYCTANCGDRVCDKIESSYNCPKDCIANVCGDSVCDDAESNNTCPEDCKKECIEEGKAILSTEEEVGCCGSLTLINPEEIDIIGINGYCSAKCGDGTCDNIESSYNCSEDCGVQVIDCGEDESCFDENLKICNPAKLRVVLGPQIEAQYTIKGMEGENCFIHHVMIAHPKIRYQGTYYDCYIPAGDLNYDIYVEWMQKNLTRSCTGTQIDVFNIMDRCSQFATTVRGGSTNADWKMVMVINIWPDDKITVDVDGTQAIIRPQNITVVNGVRIKNNGVIREASLVKAKLEVDCDLI